MESLLRWKAFATEQKVADVNLVCVCADPEFRDYRQLVREFEGEGVTFCRKPFDTGRPIMPHPRELLDAAENTFGLRSPLRQHLTLILAPGSRLIDLGEIARATKDISAGSFHKVFLDPGRTRNALRLRRFSQLSFNVLVASSCSRVMAGLFPCDGVSSAVSPIPALTYFSTRLITVFLG